MHNVQHWKAKMNTESIHILSVSGMIEKVKTLNFRHVRDDTINQKDDIMPSDIPNLNK